LLRAISACWPFALQRQSQVGVDVSEVGFFPAASIAARVDHLSLALGESAHAGKPVIDREEIGSAEVDRLRSGLHVVRFAVEQAAGALPGEDRAGMLHPDDTGQGVVRQAISRAVLANDQVVIDELLKETSNRGF
jgi:hypothetical protein